VIHLHEPIADYLGVPKQLILFGFCLVGLVLLTLIMISTAVAMGPSRPPRGERPHAE